MRILHRSGAVLMELPAGGIGVAAVQQISNRLYGASANLDTITTEQVAGWVQTLRVPALLIALCSWAVGSFVGPFDVRHPAPARGALAAGIVWAFFTVATIATLAKIPQPW